MFVQVWKMSDPCSDVMTSDALYIMKIPIRLFKFHAITVEKCIITAGNTLKVCFNNVNAVL